MIKTVLTCVGLFKQMLLMGFVAFFQSTHVATYFRLAQPNGAHIVATRPQAFIPIEHAKGKLPFQIAYGTG
jgi:hypothetical protein